jgi:2-polyprenyl-6-methoxyphenol hydroxylase-like FAD-dependent oxidoreductase
MPRTLEVFDDLGIIGPILKTGGPFPPFRAYSGHTVLWDRGIHEMAGFPKLEATPDVPYHDFWMVPQWRTGEILRDRLTELGGTVELATELTGFTQDEEGVTATLTGPAGSESVRAKYLVGADGGRSFVRKSLGVGFLGESRDQDRSIIADVRTEGPDRDHWHMWTNPSAPSNRVSLCPLPGTNVFQFAAPVTTDTVPVLTLETLQTLFNERSGITDVRLIEVGWTTVYRVNVRLAEQFRVGRVFLAGDAGHVHSPAGGQGLNTGIQDAYNLGWKLAGVLAGAPGSLLDSYESERLPVAAGVLGFTSELHRRGFRSNAGPDQASGASTHDVYQLQINYRDSPLSLNAGEPAGKVRAGDRAPDAPCRDSHSRAVRLFDVFRGSHFTLLNFGVPSVAVNGSSQRLVRTYDVVRPGEHGRNDTLIDSEGHVCRAYDVRGAVAFLIRPDGYIGLVMNAGTAGTMGHYLDLVAPPHAVE